MKRKDAAVKTRRTSSDEKSGLLLSATVAMVSFILMGFFRKNRLVLFLYFTISPRVRRGLLFRANRHS
ncbi:hypothetical protein CSUI_002024 [Cystoisospora suis]|uniref:Transmembrane protein n=1 Tax=Cystoisospora suis TaxID=483139 RepID=A0A2C6LAS8_9APIC|nr:hypothetical protein CSUI_002024 [Cystoisospora suis]